MAMTGHYLPSDHTKMRGWIDRTIERSLSPRERPLDPVLQDFKDFIEQDPAIKKLATDMFQEVPITPPYDRDPTKFKPQIRSYDEMLECINIILSEGPPWYDVDDGVAMGMIGFPITVILEWPMGTSSGYTFFRDPSVNAHWMAVLNRWKTLLSSSESLKALNSATGWTSTGAIRVLTDVGNNGADTYTFSELYQCDPSAPYYGFTSWDDFFTRKFNDGVRPIAYPDYATLPVPGIVDPTSVIVNACESIPCSRKENVKLHDTFWLKSQPYSLADMLHGEEIAKPFVGGQVYQAFLSALSYHRWHAPVSGIVISVANVAGTYYSANYHQGFANIIDGKPRPDPLGPNKSQPYMAEVATRGIITIQADNEKIGLMAAVFIGMCEVSSCEFFVRAGERVTKGQPIGSFHFGGSSHCLVFRPETKLRFDDPGPYDDEQRNRKVNSLLAIVM